jgi:imidazole glycerol-phosphate synthase subunit HisH
MQTVLIDHGAGNLHSVEKALVAAGLACTRSDDPALAADADALVLPGQGHFGQVMRSFQASGFEGVVRAHLAAGRPFLGICVGLQLLSGGSEEAPGVPGLGLIPATVRRLQADGVSVPQMGWNTLARVGRSPLLDDVPDGAYVYFANSYVVEFADARGLVGAQTRYGASRFLSAVSIGALHATQFHPEKSQGVGLQVLRNFGKAARDHLASGAAAAGGAS